MTGALKHRGKIDLHMHTTVSDGTDAPEAIVGRVKEAGISLFSVTDHDSFKGAEIIRGVLEEDSPQFVTGAEFSCRDEDGKYHILGYGFDPSSEEIRDIVGLAHALRVGKVKKRLDFIRSEFGFSFSEEDVCSILSADNPGKPHIANMMVKYGYAENRAQAITRFLNAVHFKNEYIRPEEAISAIKKSGGVPVLAHPSFGSGDQIIMGLQMEERLVRLTSMGLEGVEAFYSGFSEKLRNEMLAFADRFGLYVTAGSDYHGSNKLVSLGDTGLSDISEAPDNLKEFLRRVIKQ